MISSLSPSLPRVALQSLFFAAAIAAAAVFAGAGNANAAFSTSSDGGEPATSKNVLGQDLGVCSTSPMTGFNRDGRCDTGAMDYGTHTVCAQVTTEFLDYTRGLGNDLVTPRPEYRFPGLKEGDGWCLCASRWREAMVAGVAPPVVLEATHDKTLQYVELAELQKHAVSLGRNTE